MNVDEKVEKFFSKFKLKKIAKGNFILRGGEDPLGIFYLQKGIVKQYLVSSKGNELVVNIFKQKTFFPMSWALNGTPNEYFFEAMLDLDVRMAPVKEVIDFLKSNPEVLQDLLARVLKGTDGVLLRMAHLMEGDAYKRVITELVIYGKRFAEKKEMIPINVMEKELATLAGLRLESVSRTFKKLKTKALLFQKDVKYFIVEMDRLESELENEK